MRRVNLLRASTFRVLGLCILGALVIAGRATGQQFSTNSDTAGVQAVGPDTDGFTALCQRLLSGKGGPDSRFDQLIPFSVVLTSRLTQTIVATAVRWELTGGNGAATRHIRVDHLGHAPPGHEFVPGTSVVISPAGILDGPPAPTGLGLVDNSQGSAVPRLLTRFRQQASISIHVDGVVLESGQFVGPNPYHEFELLSAESAAGSELAKAVLAQSARGDSVASVVEWLREKAGRRSFGGLASTDQGAASPTSTDWTAEYESKTARLLLEIRDTRGDAAMMDAASKLAATASFRIYR